jgi:hypothetical protein
LKQLKFLSFSRCFRPHHNNYLTVGDFIIYCGNLRVICFEFYDETMCEYQICELIENNINLEVINLKNDRKFTDCLLKTILENCEQIISVKVGTESIFSNEYLHKFLTQSFKSQSFMLNITSNFGINIEFFNMDEFKGSKHKGIQIELSDVYDLTALYSFLSYQITDFTFILIETKTISHSGIFPLTKDIIEIIAKNNPKIIQLQITLKQSEADELVTYVIKNCKVLLELTIFEINENDETLVYYIDVVNSRYQTVKQTNNSILDGCK